MSRTFYIALMIILLLFAIVCQIILGILYQNMIRETDNMTITENKILKTCKSKFATSYHMNHGVANVAIFVDKFLNRIKVGYFTMRGWSRLSGQAVLCSALAAGLGVYNGIVDNVPMSDLLPFYIICFMGIYLYFMVSSIVNEKERKEVLKTNIMDYLENTLVVKLERNSMKAEVQSENTRWDEKVKHYEEEQETVLRNKKSVQRNKEMEELSDILLEYLA